MYNIEKLAQAHILKLKPYQPGKPIETVAREHHLDLENIAKLASNETPFGPSPRAKRAMRHVADEQHLYPDGASVNLREGLAQHYHLKPENFMIGQGSNEILELLGHAFLSLGHGVVTTAYSFAVYRLVARLFNAPFFEVPVNKKFVVSSNAVADAVIERKNTRLLMLCNPNNPTGTFMEMQDLETILNRVSEDVLVVLDEAYAEIALSYRFPNSIPLIEKYPNLLILRTFSKAYGLAGLRIGYAIGNPAVIDVLNRVRQPFNTSRMAQVAALAALKDQAFVKKVRAHFKKSAQLFSDFFESRHLDYIPTCANFILVKTNHGTDVCHELEQKGLIIRPMDPYQLPDWVRISFGTDEENARLIQAMSAMDFKG